MSPPKRQKVQVCVTFCYIKANYKAIVQKHHSFVTVLAKISLFPFCKYVLSQYYHFSSHPEYF